MSMKYLISTLAIFFIWHNQFAQIAPADSDKLEISEEYSQTNSFDSTTVIPDNKKIDFGLEAGTSYQFSPGYFHGPGYYIAPNLNYKVSPKFLLTAGVRLGYSALYPLAEESNSEHDMLPMTRMFLYARGSYLLSERLRFSGTVYHIKNDIPYRNKDQNKIDYNYQGMSMGVDYEIIPGLSVGVHVSFQNGNHLIYDNLYNGYYSPYPYYGW